jgi:hypothetical protein
MSDKQPEALRLADALDVGHNYYAESSLWFDRALAEDNGKAADELRRLHEVEKQRDELLHALKLCLAMPDFDGSKAASVVRVEAKRKAKEAIAKAEGKA